MVGHIDSRLSRPLRMSDGCSVIVRRSLHRLKVTAMDLACPSIVTLAIAIVKHKPESLLNLPRAVSELI
jgi:hypothetical protein